LARPVGADQAEDPSRRQLEVHLVHRPDPPEPPRYGPAFEDCIASGGRGCRYTPSTTARTLAGPVAAGCAGDEHRTEDVGAVQELVGGALEADLALLHEHGSASQVEGQIHRLLDEDDGGAGLVDALH